MSEGLRLISGSLRTGSLNRLLLAEAARAFGTRGIVASIAMPLYDGDMEDAEGPPPEAHRLSEQIAAADAVAVATPEYNHSLSGSLKNALDWVSRIDGNPWLDKPVAIMSAAAGRTGGARAQYALRLALNPFRPRLLTGPELMVAQARTAFGEDGRLTNERYAQTLETLMAALRKEVDRGR